MSVVVKSYSGLEEAASALSADNSARYLGGGTLLMRAVNSGDQSFTTVVRANDPAAKIISAQGDRITIGAGVTMAQIIASRDVEFLAPVARLIGGPAIRTMGTVGGNLFAHAPFGDLTTALLALDATVTLAGNAAEQPLETFLGVRENAPRPLVVSVSIRRPQTGTFRFRKVSRIKPKGASVLAIAALLPQSGGRVSGARIAYGSMAPVSVRMPAVEQALEGASLDEAGIGRALAAATEGLDPPTDALASTWYRRAVAPVHLKRLLLGLED